MNIKRTFTSGHLVVIAGGILCFYHTLYALLCKQAIMPNAALRLDRILTALFVAACLIYFGDHFFRHTDMREGLRSCCESAVNRYSVTLGILFLLFFVSTILMGRANPGAFQTNRDHLYDSSISFFVIFPLGYWLGFRKDDRLLCAVIDMLTLLYTGFLALGLLSLYANIRFPFMPEEIYIWDGRLYLDAHPNYTGMMCATLMMAGLYRILRGRKWVKLPYLAAEVILTVGLLLTDSRASMVAVVVAFGALIALCVWKWFGKNKSTGKMIWICAATLIVSMGVLWFLRKLGPVIGGSDFQIRKLFGDSLGAGNGRVDLWWAIVTDILPHNKALFLHGCSPSNIWSVLSALAGTVEKFGYAINTHNQILEVGMAYGVPAMGVFLVWLGMLARCCWAMGTAPFREVSFAERIIPLMLLLLVTNNMFETTLLFYRYATGSLFFLAAGHVCGYYAQQKSDAP